MYVMMSGKVEVVVVLELLMVVLVGMLVVVLVPELMVSVVVKENGVKAKERKGSMPAHTFKTIKGKLCGF